MSLYQQLEDPRSFVSRVIRDKAQKLLRHPAFSESDRQDLEQELALELICKSPQFDPGRAAKRTFIVWVIDRKLISIWRKCVADMRDYRLNGHSLSEAVRDADDKEVERARTMPDHASRRHTGRSFRSDEEVWEMQMDLSDVLQELPDELRKVAKQLTAMTRFAASRELKMSRRQVAKAVAQLLRRFDAAGLRDFL